MVARDVARGGSNGEEDGEQHSRTGHAWANSSEVSEIKQGIFSQQSQPGFGAGTYRDATRPGPSSSPLRPDCVVGPKRAGPGAFLLL